MKDPQPASSLGTPFTKALFQQLFNCQFNEHTANYDADRFGPRPQSSLRDRIGVGFRRFLRKLGLAQRDSLNRIQWKRLEEWAALFSDLDWLHGRLEDDRSRKLLVSLVAYRLMGPRAISLPRNNANFWNLRKKARSVENKSDAIPSGFKGWNLHRFELSSLGMPIQVYSRPSAVVAQFLMEQYVSKAHGIEVGEGDVAIDAGGCWGDTALNFAHRCGPKGRVLSFEFTPENLTVYRRNLELNPDLAPRITIIEKAVWDNPDDTLAFKTLGPATSATRPNQKGESISIKTETIDNLVENGTVDRVDFIKMDIEGAEMNALNGAERVLRRFKPRLAISLYHSPEDFVEIPRFLDSLDLGYRFSIDHFTIHAEETVLFAW